MSTIGSAFFEGWLAIAAFAAGALLPRRHVWFERVALGAIAALTVVFVSTLWPQVGQVASGEAKPEWPWLLNALVFLPILGSALVLFLPRQAPQLLRTVTLGILGVGFVLSLKLLATPMEAGWHFQYIAPWVPSLGIRYHVAVDGISLWLVILSTFTTPIAAYVSFGSLKQQTKELCFALLLLQGGMLGAFVAMDMFLFYVFWELMLIPMFILIGIWGGIDKIKASYKFFLYTMAGSMLMLAAILYMVWAHLQVAGYLTFDYLALSRLSFSREVSLLLFGGFAVAFLVKVPMWPVHTWLPDAHVQAPTGGSIILAAVLLKLGTYGYIRFCMGMFGGAAWMTGPTLAGVAITGGILYGALVAWQQDDIKRLVAYSSVAHMGFVMLGLFAATQSSMEGAILQMVNHGIATGALFLLVGVIYDRRHTRMVREFGGLAKVMPVYTTIFIVVTMASIGVPGTNGFVGEFMIIMGTYVSEALGRHGPIQAIVASVGVVLAAVYMLGMVQKVFFGPIENEKNRHLPDISVREVVAVAPLVAMIFAIGFFPQVFTTRMSAGVRGALEQFNEGRSAYIQTTDDDQSTKILPRRSGAWSSGYPEAPAAPGELVAAGKRGEK